MRSHTETETRPKTRPKTEAGKGDNTGPDTDGYLVDYSSAEQLSRCFERFTPVQIRETLEYEPFTEAMRLLKDFSRAAEPYRELKHYSMVNELGYYRSRRKRPSAQEEYDRYLGYLQVKNSVHWAKNGTRLTARQCEDLTRAFYAPAYRAEMSKLSGQSWNANNGTPRQSEDQAPKEKADEAKTEAAKGAGHRRSSESPDHADWEVA